MNAAIKMFMMKLLAHQVTPHHMLDLLVATTSNGEVHKGVNNNSNIIMCLQICNLVACNYQLFVMLIRGGESQHEGETKFGVIIGLQKFQAP